MTPSNLTSAATRLVRILMAGTALTLALPFAMAGAAPCVVPLQGKWQQTHTLIQGNKIPDDTQSWVFKPDGTMLFAKTKPALSITGKYQCDGYTIQVMGRMSNSFKIVEHGLDTMTLESSLGGTVFVKHVPK
jgi:hypothetical protein